MRNGPSDLFHDCIASIYSTALDPENWWKALARIARFTNANSAAFVCSNPCTRQPLALHVYGIDPLAKTQYVETYSRIDPWVRGFLDKQHRIDPQYSFSGQFLVPDREYVRSQYYADFASHLGHRWLKSGLVSTTRTRFAYLGIYRQAGTDDFSAEERDRYDSLLPHLQQAFKTTVHPNSLTSRLQALQQALDAQTSGVIMLDARGRIIEMSQMARAIIAADDGLVVREGRLTARHSNSSRVLDLVIASAIGLATSDNAPPAPDLTIRRPSGKRPYIVRTAPVPSTDSVISEIAGDDCAKALVFISDPEDTPEAPETLLQRLYGLTPAEARFALSLSAGNSLDGAGNDCGITRETARTRLKRIFAKTDTHSQAELVRLLLAGPAGVGRTSGT